MDWPSRLDQVKIILTWFNFIPELRKKSYQKVFFPINLIIFPLNFILKLFYGLVMLLLNWLSWLDHVMVTPTQFNFKPSSSKILGYEGYFMPVSSSLSILISFSNLFLLVWQDASSPIKSTWSCRGPHDLTLSLDYARS